MKARVFSLALAAAVAAALVSGPVLAAGDAAKGKKVFNKCKACHSLKPGKNKIGPSLAGVIGRTAGTAEGYKYSKAMKGAGVTWNEETLDKFLTKPKKFVPGTKMSFPGLRKESQRQNVIEYLKKAAN